MRAGRRRVAQGKRQSVRRRRQIIRENTRTVRVTAFGNTLTFPFEAERNARSYADGQASGSASRLRTQQVRLTV
ncbi:hypothetical protein MesoLj131c_73000 (plasmid) [Mesorhizobium sp. 131-3-5]|nr:hypothetical protein MesoLj131c_73000 [Mesorhizobium sp. 131-3-5]